MEQETAHSNPVRERSAAVTARSAHAREKAPPLILIPAYKPEAVLVQLVTDLMDSGKITAVIVVNDGSGPEYDSIFEAVAAIGDTHVLRHLVNLGKGAALKTGLNYAACTFPDCVGVVTADADGQHQVQDVLATAEALVAQPHNLVLGSRWFSTKVPFRSAFGNVLTRYVLRAVTGQQLLDTQTGLRGIPMEFVPELLRSKADGYEFELDMLLTSGSSGRRITEVPITTIYIDGNRSSHFNPVLDSMRIYFLFMRFAAVSLVTAGLDNLVFILAFQFWPSIGGSQIIGRVVACAFNYFVNKTGVFHSREQNAIALPKYLLSVVVAGFITYALIGRIITLLGFSVIEAKITAETIMFLFNFAVQRDFVFARHLKESHLRAKV